LFLFNKDYSYTYSDCNFQTFQNVSATSVSICSFNCYENDACLRSLYDSNTSLCQYLGNTPLSRSFTQTQTCKDITYYLSKNNIFYYIFKI
jgi:hypothetical protein